MELHSKICFSNFFYVVKVFCEKEYVADIPDMFVSFIFEVCHIVFKIWERRYTFLDYQE